MPKKLSYERTPTMQPRRGRVERFAVWCADNVLKSFFSVLIVVGTIVVAVLTSSNALTSVTSTSAFMFASCGLSWLLHSVLHR